MDALVHFLQPLDLHPVADHFTIALLMVGVLIDLIASLFPVRAWLRYMALTLMILGALSAGSSYATGDLEAGRIWNALSDPAKAVLHRHALLAEIAAVVFGVLALWRILIEGVSAFAGTVSRTFSSGFDCACALCHVPTNIRINANVSINFFFINCFCYSSAPSRPSSLPSLPQAGEGTKTRRLLRSKKISSPIPAPALSFVEGGDLK